jgi:hypothetical protein
MNLPSITKKALSEMAPVNIASTRVAKRDGRFSVSIALASSIAVSSMVLQIPAALAREPGAADNFAPGSSVNVPVGSIPPPGISVVNYFAYVWGPEVDALGNNAGYNVSSKSYVMQLWWNPGVKFLGADYGAFILQPFADVTIDNHSYAAIAKIGTTEQFGAANTLFKPINLSWNLAPHLYLSLAAGFYAPDGSYTTPINTSSIFTINIGNNFWTFEPEFGLSYWEAGPNGYNVTLHGLYDTNSTNPATGYRSGDQIFLDLTATKTLGVINIGFVGYYAKQVTADEDFNHFYQPAGLPLSTDTINVTSTPERLGIGATIGGKIGPALIDISYMKDAVAADDIKASTILLHVTFNDLFSPAQTRPAPAIH